MKTFIKKISLVTFFAFAIVVQGVLAQAPVSSPFVDVVVTSPSASPVLPGDDNDDEEGTTPPPANPFGPDTEPVTTTPPPASPVLPEDGNDDQDDEDETVDEPQVQTSSRRGGSSGRSRLNSVPVGELSAEGEVLGATTDNSCSMLTTFMKQGFVNSVEEVMMLQTFLNTMGANLPVTGYFGPMTHQAVKIFQLQYREQILTPWVKLGLHPSSDIATGYVYQTTRYTINRMLCPDVEITYPTLI